MVEEHTPAPQQSRGIYGFVLFILMNLCTLIYFTWMLMPVEIFRVLPYEPPQQYWGLAIPIFLCTCLFLFAFCIYPALHGLQDGLLDSASSFTDPYSLPKDYFEKKRAEAKSKTKHRNVTLHQNEQLSLSIRGKFDSNKSHTWSNKSGLKAGDIVLATSEPISAVSDMDLDVVCQLLYFSNQESC